MSVIRLGARKASRETRGACQHLYTVLDIVCRDELEEGTWFTGDVCPVYTTDYIAQLSIKKSRTIRANLCCFNEEMLC